MVDIPEAVRPHLAKMASVAQTSEDSLCRILFPEYITAPDEVIRVTQPQILYAKALAYLRTLSRYEDKGEVVFDPHMKNIHAFVKASQQVEQLFPSRSVQGVLDMVDQNDKEDPLNVHLFKMREALATIAEVARYVESVRKSLHNGQKGRPSLRALESFVARMVEHYEDLSKQDFRLFRHRGDNDLYEPVTDGHWFVHAAVQIINADARAEGIPAQYTNRNIYNVCEKVRKKMRIAKRDKMRS